MSAFPKPPTPPVVEEKSGALTDNESSFILDAELTKKRRNDPIILAFIESFIRCRNIPQASHECGIHKAEGYKIRHYVDVSNAITKITDRSAIKYGFDAAEIMERNKEIVDFDPIALQNPDGSFKSNLYDIAPEARRVLKKLKVKNLWGEQEDMNGMKKKIIVGEVIEYEFYDKQKSIELGGKEKELFKNTVKHEHSHTVNMEQILLNAANRGKEESTKVIEASFTEVAEESANEGLE